MGKKFINLIFLASLTLASCSFLSLYALTGVSETVSGQLFVGLSDEDTSKALINLLSNLDNAASVETYEVVVDSNDGIITTTDTLTSYYSAGHSSSEIVIAIDHYGAGVYYQEIVEEENEILLDEDSGFLLKEQHITSAPDISFYNDFDQYMVANWVGEYGYNSLASYDIFGNYSGLDFSSFYFGYDELGNMLAMTSYRENSFATGVDNVYIYQQDTQIKLSLSGTLEDPVLDKGIVEIINREGNSSNGLSVVKETTIQFEVSYEGRATEPSTESFLEAFPIQGVGYPKSSSLELARISLDYGVTGEVATGITIDESVCFPFQSWSNYSSQESSMDVTGIANISNVEPDYYALVVNTKIYDPWTEEVINEVLTPITGADFNTEEVVGISFIIVEGDTYFSFEEDFPGDVMEMEVILDFSESMESPTYTIVTGGWV